METKKFNKKIEEIEDLKRNLISKINYAEDVQNDVLAVIEKGFTDLIQMYKNIAVDSESIDEYTQESISLMKAELDNVMSYHKEETCDDIACIINLMHLDIEDPSEEMDKEHFKGKYEEEIDGMDLAEDAKTKKVVGMIESYLKDVILRQNRILDARGYSSDRIENVSEQANQFARYFLNKSETEIGDILQESGKVQKAALLEEFNKFLEENNELETPESEEKTPRKEFIESLDSGISLEEQNEFATNKVKDIEKEANSKDEESLDLPGDLIK